MIGKLKDMSDDNKIKSFDDIRLEIILAAMPHAIFEGWTSLTLEKASLDAGYDKTMAERVFSEGAISALLFFSQAADQILEQEEKPENFMTMSLTKRIAWLVQRRIERWEPYREALRRGAALLALPPYWLETMKSTAKTVDTLWRVAGDESTDFAWYSKRLSLAGIFTSTLMVWLQDNSKNSRESWIFLENSLARLTQSMGYKNKLKSKIKLGLSFLRLNLR